MRRIITKQLPYNKKKNLDRLEAFLDKITADTIERRIYWKKYTAEELLIKGCEFAPQLFCHESGQDPSDDANLQPFDPEGEGRKGEWIFRSHFSDEATIAKGYKGVLPLCATFLLVQVNKEDKTAWELYINGATFEKVLTTDQEPTNKLLSKIGELVGHILIAQYDAPINHSLSKMIDEYMCENADTG